MKEKLVYTNPFEAGSNDKQEAKELEKKASDMLFIEKRLLKKWMTKKDLIKQINHILSGRIDKVRSPYLRAIKKEIGGY